MNIQKMICLAVELKIFYLPPMPMIPYPGIFCRSRLCLAILLTPDRELTLVYPAHDRLFEMLLLRLALRFSLPRSRVKLFNL